MLYNVYENKTIENDPGLKCVTLNTFHLHLYFYPSIISSL